MPKHLKKDERLVPARIAARESHYSTDYITLLAREGKIFAEKIGRQWLVDLEEVLEFTRHAKEGQHARIERLRLERKREYAERLRAKKEEERRKVREVELAKERVRVEEELRPVHPHFVSAKSAAREVEYTTDYVTLLAREGKIAAEKVGRQWFVDPKELQQFAYQRSREQLSRRVELKELRKVEYLRRVSDFEREIRQKLNGGKRHALIGAAVTFMFVFAVGSFGYFSTNRDQLALVAGIDLSFFENTAVALYQFVTPRSWYASNDASSDAAGGSIFDQRSRSYRLQALPTKEDEQAIIRDAFSDDLEIVFDAEANDSGLIIPEFRSGSESKYRFRILLEEMLEGSS